MVKLKHVHSSGRYDRPAAAQLKALASYAKRGAGLITLTEQANASHRRTLEAFTDSHPGYEDAQGIGHGADCVIITSPEWEIQKVWAARATQLEQRRGPGGPPPAEYVTTLIRHRKTGALVLTSVLHLPSNVEGGWKDNVYRVKVWRQAHKNWSRHLSHLRRVYKCKVIMTADWNLNFRKPVFRALLKTLNPHLKLTWIKIPKRGTHGPRLIDGTLTNCKIIQGARIIQDDASSDHVPYEEILEV